MEIHIYRDDCDNSHRFNRPNYKPFVYIERYNFTLYIESAKTFSPLVFPIALAIMRVIDIQEVGYLYKSYERPHKRGTPKGITQGNPNRILSRNNNGGMYSMLVRARAHKITNGPHNEILLRVTSIGFLVELALITSTHLNKIYK